MPYMQCIVDDQRRFVGFAWSNTLWELRNEWKFYRKYGKIFKIGDFGKQEEII